MLTVPFHGPENQGSAKLSNLSKTVQPVSDGGRLGLQIGWVTNLYPQHTRPMWTLPSSTEIPRFTGWPGLVILALLHSLLSSEAASKVGSSVALVDRLGGRSAFLIPEGRPLTELILLCTPAARVPSPLRR